MLAYLWIKELELPPSFKNRGSPGRLNDIRDGYLSQPSTLELSEELSNTGVRHLRLFHADEDLDLSGLANAAPVKSLDVAYCRFNRVQWQAIWRMKRLQELKIYSSRIKDEDLDGIENLSNLQSLVLLGGMVTDQGMERISQLQHLAYLELGSGDHYSRGPNLTEAGEALARQMTRTGMRLKLHKRSR